MKLFRVAPINFRQHDFIIKVMLLYTCFKERLLIKSLTQQSWLDWVVFFKDIYLWEQGRLQSACGVKFLSGRGCGGDACTGPSRGGW